MTILSSIRNRVGLLVGIIFLALLAFVLGDVFTAKNSFGGSANTVGIINGNEISAVDFSNELTALSNGENLTQEQQDQYSEALWQDMIRRNVFEPQFEELGIAITTDELTEQMVGDNISPYMNQFFQNPQTGQVAPDFADPMTGQLSPSKVRTFVGKMDAEMEIKWSKIELDMRKVLMREKYNTLLRKGFYATNAEVKHEYADENTKYNYKYIVKRYSDINDSTITPTKEEMRNYYDNNLWKFKQPDAVRSIEYVAFNIFPSANDIADQKKAMETMVPEFKAVKPADDSLFVLQKSDAGMFVKSYLHPGQFPAGSDSAFLKANPGEVLGPFITSGDNITIYKVYGKKTSTDSVKVRHILIAHKDGERADPGVTRTKVEAKAKADSILRVVKSGKTKMEDIVEKTTDDPGSKQGNKGDYGWFAEESGFVQEFKDAGFKNPKGATVVVETDFGYHVIQVLDKSSESTKVQVAAIDKKIEPSENTMRDVYSKSSEFAGKNNTGEAFTAAVKKDGLSLLKSEPITENTKQINGFENPKELIRWLFDEKTEVGTVSSPFQNSERYLVARVVSVLERGTKPFEDETVQEICKAEAIKQKKADRFTDEFTKAGGKTIEETAVKAGNLPVMPGVNATFAAPSIQGAGFEPGVIGTLASLAPGATSAPVKGSLGVYIVKLETVVKPEPMKPADAKAKQATIIAGMASRADSSAEGVLKDAADIVDYRSRYF
jgi:peptidyl-prolyl cis-trans isomerase D